MVGRLRHRWRVSGSAGKATDAERGSSGRSDTRGRSGSARGSTLPRSGTDRSIAVARGEGGERLGAGSLSWVQRAPARSPAAVPNDPRTRTARHCRARSARAHRGAMTDSFVWLPFGVLAVAIMIFLAIV